MAVATVTQTAYGYSVTGGTDETVVNAGKLRIKAIAFSGNSATNTCVLTTTEAGAAVSFYKWAAITANHAAENHVYFGESGVEANNLKVTLNNTGSYLYIFLR